MHHTASGTCWKGLNTHLEVLQFDWNLIQSGTQSEKFFLKNLQDSTRLSGTMIVKVLDGLHFKENFDF